MNYLKKVKCYLETLRFKSTSVYLNPTTFLWENRKSLKENNIMTEFVLPVESMQLTLYQKYIRVKKEPKDKYSYFFCPPEYEWKLAVTFCSRFVYDEYETENEKLIATPYIAITEEQYQALLASKIKRRKRSKRKKR